MSHKFVDLKHSIDLPNGVTLAYTRTGEIVAIDKDGARKPLDTDDHVKWFFYSVTDSFPQGPRLPTASPEAIEAGRQARARLSATKQASTLTGYKDADGNMVIALEDGTTVTLPSA